MINAKNQWYEFLKLKGGKPMKKDYLEALMKALIVGAVVLLIFTGAMIASEMDERIESPWILDHFDLIHIYCWSL